MQWRNDALGAPDTLRGHVIGGRKTVTKNKNVGQFCKINCGTSESDRLVNGVITRLSIHLCLAKFINCSQSPGKLLNQGCH